MSPVTADGSGLWLGNEQRALAAWRDHCAARATVRDLDADVVRIDVRTA